MPLRLDATDRRIVRELIADGALTNVALAQRVGLSAPPCLRRVRALEDAGVIQGYTAVVDPKAYGLPFSVFVSVRLIQQNQEHIAEFEKARTDIATNPANALLWQSILQQYAPTLLSAADQAIKWTREIGAKTLREGLFQGDPEAARKSTDLVEFLISHDLHRAHGRHLHRSELSQHGLNITELEEDDELQDAVEPGTPTAAARLATVSAAAEAGFDVSVFMMPVLPFLTDSSEQLDAALARIKAAGAASVTYSALHLRPGVKEWFAQFLHRHHPELVSKYRALYRDDSYAPKSYRRALAERIKPLIAAHGLARTEVLTSDRSRRTHQSN